LRKGNTGSTTGISLFTSFSSVIAFTFICLDSFTCDSEQAVKDYVVFIH